MLKKLAIKILTNRAAKIVGGGLATLLSLIGGITSFEAVQPAVEKASDYAAKAVELYCHLPAIDRERFRAEVDERLIASSVPPAAQLRVICPADLVP